MSRTAGKAPSQRQLRVGEEVRHALAGILGRGGFADPDLAEVSITVTEVRVGPDLKEATAFVTPLGGRSLETVVAALNRAAGYVRAQLGREVNLKFLPRLTFRADRSFDAAERLNRLLDRPRVRRDLEEPGTEVPADRQSRS